MYHSTCVVDEKKLHELGWSSSVVIYYSFSQFPVDFDLFDANWHTLLNSIYENGKFYRLQICFSRLIVFITLLCPKQSTESSPYTTN